MVSHHRSSSLPPVGSSWIPNERPRQLLASDFPSQMGYHCWSSFGANRHYFTSIRGHGGTILAFCLPCVLHRHLRHHYRVYHRQHRDFCFHASCLRRRRRGPLQLCPPTRMRRGNCYHYFAADISPADARRSDRLRR